jgi:hypothetical protein
VLAQDEEEHGRGQESSDHERCERTDRVHVVGSREGDGAPEALPKGDAFDRDRRDDEADEGEPRDRRQHDQAVEERHREEDEVAGERRRRECSPRGPDPVHEQRRRHVRRCQEERADRQDERKAPPPTDQRQTDPGGRRPDP